jgi:N-hydroxyarylamine O-acetyltransferase
MTGEGGEMGERNHVGERGARVGEYLARIGDDGPLDVSIETLARLHRAHLLAVPFENLDIHLGRPIRLDLDRIFEKIVRRRRGGFCYELNGLFAWLLGELGFDVAMVSARVANDRGELGPEFDHMALVVRLERSWLADVGFGASSREPLALGDAEERSSEGIAYRVASDADGWRLIGRDERGDHLQYRFAEVARRLDEYEPMCRFHQTSPESHFTRKRICSLATADGRVTLGDSRLIVTRDGERTERELDAEEYAAALRDLFGVELDEPFGEP